MNPKDLKTPADVVTWLKHHVEWNDESSRDMMLRAVEVLTPSVPEWCEHCPFAKHVHYEGEAGLVAPGCPGFAPKVSASA